VKSYLFPTGVLKGEFEIENEDQDNRMVIFCSSLSPKIPCFYFFIISALNLYVPQKTNVILIKVLDMLSIVKKYEGK